MPAKVTGLHCVVGAAVVIVLTSTADVAKAEAPYPVVWSRQLGPSASVYGESVAVDGFGNAYMSGFTRGGLDGNTSAGDDDAYLTKYDPSGNKLWTRLIGTAGIEISSDVAVDATGNTYISGYTNAALDGNASAGNYDAFLAKYDPSGNKLWTRQIGTTGSDLGRSVSVDIFGNAYLSGYTPGNLDGNINAGDLDAFLTKYDPSGNKLWTQQIGTHMQDVSNAVAIDASGNAYITGYTWGGLDGNTNGGLADGFLVKYDPAGNKLWTQQINAPGDQGSWSVDVDLWDNVFISGTTQSSILGNPYNGGYDAFLIKFAPIPEPASLAMLSVVSLVLFRRNVH